MAGELNETLGPTGWTVPPISSTVPGMPIRFGSVSNIAIGNGALQTDLNDERNLGIGKDALRYLVKTEGQPLQTGVNNVALGYESMAATAASCSNNTAVGVWSLNQNASGYCNSALGFRSLYVNVDGIYNTGIGCDTLLSLTSGNDNTAIGAKALLSVAIAGDNTAVGNSALRASTASENTAVGSLAAYSATSATQQVAIGFRASELNLTGAKVTAIGSWALRTNTAANNTAVGADAAINSSTGDDLVAVGVSALRSNTTGARNVGVGNSALQNVGVGTGNVGIGHLAGNAINGGSSNTDPVDSIFIGRDARAAAIAQTNQIVIGAFTVGDGSNTVAIGTTATVSHRLLGTSTSKAIINGDRLQISTAKTPASATASGATGEIAWDASFIYVCTATNTWKRAAIATW